jgi:hypothetical protein
MPFQITDGERTVTIDKVSHAINTITYEHHEIHGGGAYRGGYAGVLAGDATKDVTLLTPSNGKQCHIVIAVDTSNSADAWFYELMEVTSNGTPITPRNANRNIPDESSLQAFFVDGTVVTTNAVILGHRHVGAEGSRPGTSIGGSASVREEWILKENTWYTLRLSDTSSEDQNVLMRLEWYEHTPKG